MNRRLPTKISYCGECPFSKYFPNQYTDREGWNCGQSGQELEDGHMSGEFDIPDFCLLEKEQEK